MNIFNHSQSTPNAFKGIFYVAEQSVNCYFIELDALVCFVVDVYLRVLDHSVSCMHIRSLLARVNTFYMNGYISRTRLQNARAAANGNGRPPAGILRAVAAPQSSPSSSPGASLVAANPEVT